MTPPTASHRLHPLALAGGIAWTALAAGSAGAQQQQQLPPIEVIGVSPIPGLDVPRDQIPANVQTARSQDIERTQALDLSSFMNRRLGSVFINEIQNNPFQPDVNYRGYTASPLLGTQQGLSLYLDGVRLNQPFGDVVSWDLIPKAAIASLALNPGSNPLFGLNTLGGAIAVKTKDGLQNPGTSVQLLGGSHHRAAGEFEHGGASAGTHWYVTANSFHERGWRDDSPSDVTQVFGKVGTRRGDTDVALSAAFADTDLNGNGLQEQRLLERDDASVYTKPDNTKNRSYFVNLALSQSFSPQVSATGNVYDRRISTRTYNGDLNDDSLDQAVYQPNAAERAALTGAGYSGFPTSGETAANTPFPKWRCIANALLRDEPAEKCNGVVNQSQTRQHNYGFTGQLNFDGRLFGMVNKSLVGAALDASRSRFKQGSELGYLNPDRSITGVGAFGDGVNGGDVDGEPYDTRVDLTGRTRTYSVFASTIVSLTPNAHLTLAGRYNHSSIKNRDAITPGGSAGSLDGDHVYARFNPAVGLTLTPVAGLNVWAGANQGSRDPSSIELGCADPANPCKLPNAFAGDPPLAKVVTTTYEAGLRGTAPAGIAWSVGVFRSNNKDDLLFVADDASGFGYFKNFGRTRRQGVELGLSLQPLPQLTIGANYTWLQATFRSSEVVDGSSNSSNSENADEGLPGVEGTIQIERGDRIPLVPRQMVKLYADLDIGAAWSFGAEMTAFSRSTARGNENGAHQPDGVYYLGPGDNAGYAVFNLNAAYKPTKGLKLFAQVDNVLNRQYSTAAQLGATGFTADGSFIARPFPANAEGDRPLVHSTFYAPGAPRKFSLGAKYTF